MIKDPVNMKRKTDRLVIEHFQRTTEPFFYVTDNLIGLLKNSGIPFWSIARPDDNGNQYYRPGCYVGVSGPYDNRRTKDEMMALLESEYPEYLEWFLWNPGWMR